MSLKSTTLISLALALSTASSASATGFQVEEQWLFSETDGTQMSSAFSNLANRFAPNVPTPGVTTQGQELEFLNSQSYFMGNIFTNGNHSSGMYTLSWDYTQANLSNSTFGTLGVEIRDDTSAFATIRLRVLGTDLALQYAAGDTLATFSTIETFSGLTLSDLNITATIDLDNAGSAGSFKIGYQLGVNPAIEALSNGVAGTQFEAYRIIQQADIGSFPTDSILLDNFTLSVAAPEPSTYALLLGSVISMIVLVGRRKRTPKN